MDNEGNKLLAGYLVAHLTRIHIIGKRKLDLRKLFLRIIILVDLDAYSDTLKGKGKLVFSCLLCNSHLKPSVKV